MIINKKNFILRKIYDGWELVRFRDLQAGDIFRTTYRHRHCFEAVSDSYIVDGELGVRFKEIDPKSLTFDEPGGKYTLALSSDEAAFLRKIAQ
jgi:hypothetical protein